MELELERIGWNGYEAALETTVCQEETLESIVPDACPDVLRICETEAIVCLRDKVVQEGRLTLSGSVRASLLYLPDGGEGLRRMEVELPFTCPVEHPGLTPEWKVVAVPQVQGADARLLNPRKVLVRVSLAVWLQACAPVEEELCGGIQAPEEAGIQQLVEPWEACSIVCLGEKPFTFSDEIALSGSKPEAEELLKSRVTLRCSESKVIGNKLIFKGESQLQFLYRSTAGALCTAEYELPFSQIMEVSGAGEESVCQVQVVLTDLECTLDQGDGRTISVSMGLLAQAVVRDTRTLELLTDVYSTAYPLTAERKSCTLRRLAEHGEREAAVREILETGQLAQEVSDAYVTLGAVTQSREGTRLTLAAEAYVTVLYRTEDGACSSVTRQLQAACPLELPEDASCTCLCSCTAPVFATPTAGGIEVRCSLSFSYTALTSRTAAAVAAVQLDENAAADHAGQPSIVLRVVGAGERLWDIAKAYGTTSRDIVQANGLEEELAPEGQLLLIPRKR